MRARIRFAMIWLAAVAALYLAVCAFVWWKQDALVFPGAGYGDRGVPFQSPLPVVGWVGEPGSRVRIATVAARNAASPRAVVVYFGGNGEDLFMAAGSALALASYGVEAIAAEHPGYGASEGRPSVETLLGAATRVAAFARGRAQQLGVPFVVFGSSLGTFCAVHVAAAGGVDQLVLRSPPTTLRAVAGGHYAWLPVGLLLSHRFDSLALAPRVKCPVLVLHGDRDTIVPERFGRELAAAFPNARFVSVAGRGHNDIDPSPQGPVGAVLAPLFAPR